MAEKRYKLLHVDDDRTFVRTLARALGPLGYSDEIDADLVLFDPAHFTSTAAALDWLRTTVRGLPAVALTASPKVTECAALLRSGLVIDYLIKPASPDAIAGALSRAIERSITHRPHARSVTTDAPWIAADPVSLAFIDVAQRVARSNATIVIDGEPGTGKTLLARWMHAHSPRAAGPLVSVSCGALSDTLLDSELFGHVAGAFTGADTGAIGRFAAAAGGTILLDEIDAASPALQVKLLRVLQERTFEPVGSDQTQQADVRIIAATNADLPRLVETGSFRADLFYRLNVVPLTVPPLRDRPIDVGELARHALAGDSDHVLTHDAIDRLSQHDWPGNVRELLHTIERAAVLAKSQTIDVCDLSLSITPDRALPAAALTLALESHERAAIEAALEAAAGNRTAAARALGIERTTLYKKMKRLGLRAA